MNKKYSSYRNGLEIGDLVYYGSSNSFFFKYAGKYNGLVLDREFLFKKDTRFGVRSFFKYMMLNIETQQIIEVETQNIKVLKTIKGK